MKNDNSPTFQLWGTSFPPQKREKKKEKGARKYRPANGNYIKKHGVFKTLKKTEKKQEKKEKGKRGEKQKRGKRKKQPKKEEKEKKKKGTGEEKQRRRKNNYILKLPIIRARRGRYVKQQ